MRERIDKIKEIIAKRDSFKDVDGETDYTNYDIHGNELNDDGHVDWLVEQVDRLSELDSLEKVLLSSDKEELIIVKGRTLFIRPATSEDVRKVAEKK